MQITKPKLMGIINDDSVDIRNIYATFHNVGTNQHIVFLLNKIQDSLFQFVTFHLTVCETDA